jgi:hypothetical protein
MGGTLLFPMDGRRRWQVEGGLRSSRRSPRLPTAPGQARSREPHGGRGVRGGKRKRGE